MLKVSSCSFGAANWKKYNFAANNCIKSKILFEINDLLFKVCLFYKKNKKKKISILLRFNANNASLRDYRLLSPASWDDRSKYLFLRWRSILNSHLTFSVSNCSVRNAIDSMTENAERSRLTLIFQFLFEKAPG